MAVYKPREPGSFKQACAQLVDACGGQKAAAALLGCKPQHVARLTDDDFPKAQLRVDHILLLQKQCGRTIVTDWMAAEQGCVVEAIELCSHEPLPILVGRITTETGELLSAAARDMQSGTLTVANAASVIDETDDVIGPLLILRSEAKAVLAKRRA